MARIIIPRTIKGDMLKIFVGNIVWTSENAYLRLFVNNYTPTDTSVQSDFTEASWAGYAAELLTNTAWTLDTSSSLVTLTANASLDFSNSNIDINTAYGWYITSSTRGLLASLRFDSPLVFQKAYSYIYISPLVFYL